MNMTLVLSRRPCSRAYSSKRYMIFCGAPGHLTGVEGCACAWVNPSARDCDRDGGLFTTYLREDGVAALELLHVLPGLLDSVCRVVGDDTILAHRLGEALDLAPVDLHAGRDHEVLVGDLRGRGWGECEETERRVRARVALKRTLLPSFVTTAFLSGSNSTTASLTQSASRGMTSAMERTDAENGLTPAPTSDQMGW